MSDDIEQLLSRAVYSPEELQSLKEALGEAIVRAEAEGRIRDSIVSRAQEKEKLAIGPPNLRLDRMLAGKYILGWP
jgi:hypothetical protein